MKFYYTFIIVLFYGLLFSQNKQDYVWFFGLDHTPSDIDKGYRFDFKIKPFSIPVTNNGIGFASNNASICDKNGNLLFYTNGCAVLNRDAEIMPNGDSINEDIWKKISGWDMCESGYPGTQNIMILDDPANIENNKKQYYIIHKPRIFTEINSPDSNHLRYTIVDMNLDNGLGDVVQKDITFYRDKDIVSSYLTAIRHENGVDWWIIQPARADSIFLTFLITKDGIEEKENQNSHEYFRKIGTSAAGTARFSPDGSKYALYAYKNNLHIYDFDRSTGLITNHHKIIIYDSIDFNDIRFNSVEWSPNSRFIYTASRDELHQIDTWEDDLQDGVRLIDVYNGTKDPFWTTFFLMAQGPDCRIYMCPTSSTRSYHVINHPNRLGKACDFVQNGIKLPKTSGAASMPNFPRFRVDEEDKCDSTIVSVFGDYVYYRRDLKVYPNPSTGVFNVEMPESLRGGTLVVTDINGRVVYKVEVANFNNPVTNFNNPVEQINITGLPTGRYNIEVYPYSNSKLQTSIIKERVFYGVQVVLVDN